MSRRECWGVYHRERGWFVDDEDRDYTHKPNKRAEFTFEQAKAVCDAQEYPRRFWRVKKDKAEWREMSDPPDTDREVLVHDGVNAVVVHYRRNTWLTMLDGRYASEPTDKWCELPTR